MKIFLFWLENLPQNNTMHFLIQQNIVEFNPKDGNSSVWYNEPFRCMLSYFFHIYSHLKINILVFRCSSSIIQVLKKKVIP